MPGFGVSPKLDNFDGAFPVDAADFGASAYLYRTEALVGAADSKTGIFSCWMRVDNADATERALLRGGAFAADGCNFDLDGTNRLAYGFLDLIDGEYYGGTINTYPEASSAWIHVFMSWDLNISNTYHFFVDGAPDSATPEFINNFEVPYSTVTAWNIGGNNSTYFPVGSYAELYFAPGQWLDPTDPATILKYRSTTGRPAFLGVDGSRPTGVAPAIYLHLGDGDDASAFATNRGTGGDFTISSSLTTASTSPSD